MRIPLVLMLAAWLITGMACSNAGEKQPVHFLVLEAEFISTSMTPGMVRLGLQGEDQGFYGWESHGDDNLALLVAASSSDESIAVLFDAYDVRGKGRHALDSTTGGRLTVLMGDVCEKGMGHLTAPDCHWYSSDFYQRDCSLDLESVSGARVTGRIVCAALGANCPSGTGAREQDGTCADGEQLAPLSLSLRFSLSGPATPETVIP